VASGGVGAQPNGFLVAMIPKDGISNHIFPYSLNPVTGAATVLGDGDYIMASLQNTQNGGTYNQALAKVQFIGQSLTAEQGPTPNPTMNFLVAIDQAGDYTSSRMIAYSGGQVNTARAQDGSSGRVFGMEQNSPTTDARLDIIEDSGLCTNFVNTSATGGYITGYAALNSAANMFYVGVKNGSGYSLQTIDTHGTGARVNSVALTGSPIRVMLCWDAGTHTLVSLERASSTSDSQLNRLDPNTGHTSLIVTLPGKATQGDCRSGFFFASGTSSSGSAWLSVVDIAAGKIVRNTPKLSVPAPSLLVFYPQ